MHSYHLSLLSVASRFTTLSICHSPQYQVPSLLPRLVTCTKRNMNAVLFSFRSADSYRDLSFAAPDLFQAARLVSCRHIQAHASSCNESGMAGSTIRQSFCSALQAEVAEFSRLIAVLQEQSMREAPKPSSLSSGENWLSCLQHCLMSCHCHLTAML